MHSRDNRGLDGEVEDVYGGISGHKLQDIFLHFCHYVHVLEHTLIAIFNTDITITYVDY